MSNTKTKLAAYSSKIIKNGKVEPTKEELKKKNFIIGSKHQK